MFKRLKNLTIGKRLALGFGCVIALAVLVSTLSIVKMNDVSTSNTALVQKEMPAMDGVSNFNNAIQLARYNYRGFALTFDSDYYNQTVEALKKVSGDLTTCQKLAEEQKMNDLATDVKELQGSVGKYAQQLGEMKGNVDTYKASCVKMDAANAEYSKLLHAYLAHVNQLLGEEIKANPPTETAKLIERVSKVTIGNELIELGNTVVRDTIKAQSLRDPKILKATLPNFDAMSEKIDHLLSVSTIESSKQQLTACRAANETYKKVLLDITKDFEQIDVIRLNCIEIAKNIIKVSDRATAASLASTTATANTAVTALSVATKTTIIGMGVMIVIAFGMAWGTTRSIVVPIKGFVDFTGLLAQGDFSKDIAPESCKRGDEMGDLARGFEKMVSSTRSLLKSMMENSQTVASSATELAATATQLAGGAEETTNQSAQVAAAAEEMSTNMGGMSASTEEMSTNIKVMASAIEELTSSISEVAKSAERAAGVAGNAAQLVSTSNSQIGELGNAADEIGKVIEVIQDIAEQTNLLALNATIEAARAGDAGKGFAVVATEVKELAKQTATATEDIRKRIEGIQGSTGLTVKSIGDISEVVKQVNDLSRTIASAVEEQSITTKEIAKNVSQSSTAAQTVARSVAESATATQEITRSIVGVDQAAKQAAQGAAQTQITGRELSRVAEQLQIAVGQFKV
jgi:methyl-accepting chemotaxis protein